MNQDLVNRMIEKEKERMRKVGYSLITKAIDTGKIEDGVQRQYYESYKNGNIGLNHQLKEVYPIQ